MSQVPARLVYTDSNNNEQTIGSFQPQDATRGNISTFTIEEEALNYKRVIIEGGPTLQDSMPTSLSEFGTDEPEIRVEVDFNLDGTWETRARVYPEVEGTTDNSGRYKNKNLWGFKKYIGEDDVEVTSSTNGPITTNLEDALDALLPSGYTARYPSDITAPSVSNYTFSGSRQQAFREIQRRYNHYIIFTTETDGSGNYYVDLQPEGYGAVQFSLTRGNDNYTYNYWKKADSSNVVSKVKVIGTDSNNNEINRIIAAGAPNGVHGSDTNNVPDDFVDADSIVAVDTTNGIFTISGDKRNRYPNGAGVEVFNSTGNDGTYQVENTDYDATNDETDITVVDAGSVTDSTADGSIVPKPARRKFKRVHIDYTITTAEADLIAKRIIEPSAVEQGEVEHELNVESTLNQSVGIVDKDRTPDNPIDDIFTVVKQKDFLHQGVTQYSFEFEKEATQQQVDKWTEHDFERAKVYPNQPEEVGQQGLTTVSTGQAPSDTRRDPNTGLDEDRQGENISQARFVVEKLEERGQDGFLTDGSGNGTTSISFNTNFASEPNVQVTPVDEYVDKFRATSIDSNGFTIGCLGGPADTGVTFNWKAELSPTVAGSRSDAFTFSGPVPLSSAVDQTQPGTTTAVWDGISVNISVTNFAGRQLSDVNYEINNTSTGNTLASDSGISVANSSSINIWWWFGPDLVSDSDNIEILVWNDGLNPGFESAPSEFNLTTVNLVVQSKSEHLVGEDIDTEDFDHGGVQSTTAHGVVDETNPDTDDPKTDSKNVNVATEENTDR